MTSRHIGSAIFADKCGFLRQGSFLRAVGRGLELRASVLWDGFTFGGEYFSNSLVNKLDAEK